MYAGKQNEEFIVKHVHLETGSLEAAQESMTAMAKLGTAAKTAREEGTEKAEKEVCKIINGVEEISMSIKEEKV